MIKKSLPVIILTLFVWFFNDVNIVNAESIKNFDSKITINNDSSVDVVETIQYDFGSLQKHGIYRFIPTKSNGNNNITLDFIGVSIDGQQGKYSISSENDNEKIRIGDPDITISGVHTYIIEYKVKDVIDFSETTNQFYWNITGNEWTVDIENVSSSILFNDNSISNTNLSCFQGAISSSEKCIYELKDNSFSVKSNRSLKAAEGLTIMLDFPSSLVEKPTTIDKIISFFQYHKIIYFPLFFLIFIYLLWFKYGKDDKSKSIVTQYEPPVGIKPPLMSYFKNERANDSGITAGIIYLAEQGFFKIKRIESKGFLSSEDYEVELLKNDISSLDDVEQKIFNLFFDKNSEIGSLKKISSFEEDESTSEKIKGIEITIDKEIENKGLFEKKSNKFASTFWTIGALLLMLSIFLLFSGIGFVTAASFFSVAIIFMIFAPFMTKKTAKGNEVHDYILGFKSYISMVEKDRLDFHNNPEKNPEKFMELLPYAIALGVEKKWAEKFEGIFITPPSWYQGSGKPLSPLAFSSSVSGFSSSFISSAYSGNTSSSSGGGHSGGGFSGGGSGGGGGGSW